MVVSGRILASFRADVLRLLLSTSQLSLGGMLLSHILQIGRYFESQHTNGMMMHSKVQVHSVLTAVLDKDH